MTSNNQNYETARTVQHTNDAGLGVLSEYNNQHQLLKTTTFLQLTNTLRQYTTYTYDSQTQKCKQTTTYRSDRTVDYTTDYNPNTGQMTKITYYRPNGSVYESIVFHYETPHSTRWFDTTHYHENGTEGSILNF
ncbi:DUF2963 domain-containing protein [Candidatus Phytoplasma pruni]|uniref:DUF2963 domain-containing protein n=1 Tax=Candidatus Phytoplasma pruni TaxID=479893 RepID=A0A851HGE7_9MOLU|nr:hypothetical protein [Candidatus Phytoplasma pruni]NWN45710.1 hypothetical protein [Candidatus Phytoplasma pruni]